MPTSVVFQIPIPHLTDRTVETMREELLRIAGGLNAEELHLDLAKVETVSSAGLSLFINVNRRLVAAEKHLVLTNACEGVESLLRLTRLDTLLDVRPSTRLPGSGVQLKAG
jgi:anti-anti-sigma factor